MGEETMEITREIFEGLKRQKMYKFKVITPSMEPIIKVGDNIVVDILAKDIRRFDIIVFKEEGRLICHYLWSMNKLFEPIMLQTRSMLGEKDYPIKYEDYLGKVISQRLSLWVRFKIMFLQ
jgi:signal peptidase I